MSKQITLEDAIAEAERAEMFDGEVFVATYNGEKRHVRHPMDHSITRCGLKVARDSRINPNDDREPFCRQCLGELRNKLVFKRIRK